MRAQKGFSGDKNRKSRRHQPVEMPKTVPLPIALANRFLEDIRFEKLVNEQVEWDENQWSVSPGTLCKAIILSTFTQLRAPIYRVADRFEGMDTEVLFGPGVHAIHLHPRELGRAMDRLYEQDPERIFRILALTALTVYNVSFKRIHADTTTISFYGEYTGTEEDGDVPEGTRRRLVLERGYNKDHRVECKQMVYGKLVNEHGIPLAYKAMNGSTSDVEWNEHAIELAGHAFEDLAISDGVLIADSKLMCQDHLKRLCGGQHPVRFISRIPASFAGKLEARCIEAAYVKDEWRDVGQLGSKTRAANYWTQQMPAQAHGQTLNAVVVKSSEAAKRFEHARQKQYELLKLDIQEVNRKEFACLKDAQLEYARFQKEHRNSLFVVAAAFDEEKTEIKTRGRPTKDRQPEYKSVFRLRLELAGEDVELLKHRRQQEESFVLVTNVLDMSGEDILRNYKNQQVVEIDFRLLKEPCLASVIYLEKPERIETLTMLLSVSLLIRALIQHNMRRSIAAYEGELPRIGHHFSKMTLTPTYMLFHDELCNSGFATLGKNKYAVFTKRESEQAMLQMRMYVRFAGYELEDLI